MNISFFFFFDLRNWPISEKRANVLVKQLKVTKIGFLINKTIVYIPIQNIRYGARRWIQW